MIPRSIRIRVPNLIAVRRSCRKNGGVQTYRYIHKGTLQLYIIVDINHFHDSLYFIVID